MAKYKIGSKIQWKWAGGIVLGTIEEIYFESITKEIKGKKIVRHGSKEKPAYLVKSVSGNIALKLETELQPIEQSKSIIKKRPDNGDY